MSEAVFLPRRPALRAEIQVGTRLRTTDRYDKWEFTVRKINPLPHDSYELWHESGNIIFRNYLTLEEQDLEIIA